MTETPEPKPSYRRLTPAEWEQVVVLWEAGSVTLQDLVDRFGITKSALHEGLKSRKAVKGRRAGEFAKHTEESLKSEAQRRSETIKNFRGEYHTYGDFIMKATVKELQELLKKPRAERSKEENTRVFTSLKYSAEIFNIIRDNKYHLHDLYNETEEDEALPEIGVSAYTEEEIETIKRRFDVPLIEEDDDILESARATLAEMEAPGDL